MIDVHVHFRDGRQSAKETIAHGLRIGSLCKIGSFFDMPNTDPPLTTPETIAERIRFADLQIRSLGEPLFYGVYAGVTADADQLSAVVDLYHANKRVVGLKMFAGHSTGNMGLINQEAQDAVYRALVSCGYEGVLAIHCEKESLLKPQLWEPADPLSHCDARPVEAEVASVADQIAFARNNGFAGALHICHISNKKAIDLVAQARDSGMRITCGATAHHALLDRSVANIEGNLLKMNPPLRRAEDRQAVFAALCNGQIDWIESDHAPHTLSDKAQGASGIPGFAGTLLLIRALRSSGVDEKRLEQLCGGRANEVYALDLPVNVPEDHYIESVMPQVRASYPWDPFATIG